MQIKEYNQLFNQVALWKLLTYKTCCLRNGDHNRESQLYKKLFKTKHQTRHITWSRLDRCSFERRRCVA